MTESSDLRLLELINSTNTDRYSSKRAFEEFHKRYKSYVLKVCRKCCNGFDNSEQLADDIFQNTFLKVLNKAHTFKSKTPEASKNVSLEIRAWLSRISYNELINFLRAHPDEKKLSNPFRTKSYEVEEVVLDDFNVEENADDPQPTIEQKNLDNALKELTERERHILMTSMQYFDPVQPLRHLPDDIMKGICEKYRINSDNVRQIKNRALKKLKSTIESYSK